jgi:hypothetical protein
VTTERDEIPVACRNTGMIEGDSTAQLNCQNSGDPMNGHAIGIILKELVRRATHTIRNERQVAR